MQHSFAGQLIFLSVYMMFFFYISQRQIIPHRMQEIKFCIYKYLNYYIPCIHILQFVQTHNKRQKFVMSFKLLQYQEATKRKFQHMYVKYNYTIAGDLEKNLRRRNGSSNSRMIQIGQKKKIQTEGRTDRQTDFSKIGL